MTWSEVDWDLWYSELVWLFLKNKEGVPDAEHCIWHWKTGHGPGQTYYKMSGKRQVQVIDDDPGAGAASPQQPG